MKLVSDSVSSPSDTQALIHALTCTPDSRSFSHTHPLTTWAFSLLHAPGPLFTWVLQTPALSQTALSSLTPITWPPPSHPFSFSTPEVTGRARARRGSRMRVEPQTSDTAKEHSHHLSDPSAVLSVVRFCGKEDGGERRSEAESGSFPSPSNPGPS